MGREEGTGFLLAEAYRAKGITFREGRPNELRVEGTLPPALRQALRANKLAVLAELWRRREWGKDYAADWRSHCLRDWENWRQDRQAPS